ncbi:hypothetical protein ASG22_04635 [Chryseobacterium sp. Leaf405]|uniref:hypothetical protein n=1 Tax=Chryseobacterium sp. Leaf405 TaxID=1736367 RepID=UPI0006F3863C|nr:hypothetical protein [Chryseobacterium sp. Leaf405]KQT25985.1 hypothetical protein ASG22_04635 [Chryseobacterium sp. Leaf405]
MRKTCISLCLLAGLSIIACKNDKVKSTKSKTDSTVAVEAVKSDSVNKVKTNSDENDDTLEKTTEISPEKVSIEGKYIANTCDGGRFSIEIKNVNDKPTFVIYDKTKIIATGGASMDGDGVNDGTTIAMGEIAGLYQGDKIIVQNYGNSMNEYEHFSQCGDKYLEFTKEK